MVYLCRCQFREKLKSGSSHWEISVFCTSHKYRAIMLQRLVIHFSLHYLSSSRLQEVNTKNNFKLFGSKSSRGRLQEVSDIVIWRLGNFWYFGKLVGCLREAVATGVSTVWTIEQKLNGWQFPIFAQNNKTFPFDLHVHFLGAGLFWNLHGLELDTYGHSRLMEIKIDGFFLIFDVHGIRVYRIKMM